MSERSGGFGGGGMGTNGMMTQSKYGESLKGMTGNARDRYQASFGQGGEDFERDMTANLNLNENQKVASIPMTPVKVEAKKEEVKKEEPKKKSSGFFGMFKKN